MLQLFCHVRTDSDLKHVMMHQRHSLNEMRHWPHYEPPTIDHMGHISARAERLRGVHVLLEGLGYLLFATIVFLLAYFRQCYGKYPVNHGFDSTLIDQKFKQVGIGEIVIVKSWC